MVAAAATMPPASAATASFAGRACRAAPRPAVIVSVRAAVGGTISPTAHWLLLRRPTEWSPPIKGLDYGNIELQGLRRSCRHSVVVPYFSLDGNVCALLACKDHVNLFLYDGVIVPDPDHIITGGHHNKASNCQYLWIDLGHAAVSTDGVSSC